MFSLQRHSCSVMTVLRCGVNKLRGDQTGQDMHNVHCPHAALHQTVGARGWGERKGGANTADIPCYVPPQEEAITSS